MKEQRFVLLTLSLRVLLMALVGAGSDGDESRCNSSAEEAMNFQCLKKTRVDAPDPINDGGLSEFVTTSAGVEMPRLIYGTAWKKDRTEGLVLQALRAGFSGIDTAGQPKHYFEPGVGAALASHLASGVARESIFVQTKVNRNHAADLSPELPIFKQVEVAITRSLSNLGLQYVDSLVLHSPYKEHEQTMEAWRAMEAAARAGLTRQLGISNVKSLKQLRRIHGESNVKPAVVQQRFYAKTGFEREMREWCIEAGVHFQSFWTLTANSKTGRAGRDAVVSPLMGDLAVKYGVTPQVLFFRFVMSMGIVPLTGTSNEKHMMEDLLARHVPLTDQDCGKLRELLDRCESDVSES